MIEYLQLFRAGEDGYAGYRIPAVAVTPSGAILAFCAARRAHGDWSDIDIALRGSADGGATWSPMRVLFGQGIPGPVDNPVPIVDAESGRLHFLYQTNYARLHATFSDDDGETFADPVDITDSLEALGAAYPWRVIAPGPGHGIRLRGGRLLAPVWLSDGSGTEMGAGNLGHRPSVVATVYSDDDGSSWQAGEVYLRNDGHTFINPSEAQAVEMSDGRVMINIRTESPRNRRVIVTSSDGASGWSAPRFDEALFEPVCCASLVRWGSDPGTLLFVNPDSSHLPPRKPGGVTHPRQNLTARLSVDEGQSWPVSRVLYEGVAGYSDSAVAVDGTACCLFEHGAKGASDEGITLARFDRAWIEGTG